MRLPSHSLLRANVLAAMIGATLLVPAFGAETIEIGAAKQLFLDDHLIASMSNVQRRIQRAVKCEGNPVLWPEEPWEDKLAVMYGSVIRDGERYRMWYRSGLGIAYAESDDGIQWRKPRLDLIRADGEPTNLLFRKSGGQHEVRPDDLFPYYYELFGVHKDDRDPDPQRRYKLGFLSIDWKHRGPGGDPFHPGQRRGLGVAVSPDGIRWTLLDNFATEAICDGATHWMFDPRLDRYVLYGRSRKTLPEVEAAWSGFDWYKDWHSGRAVARVESKDFVHWDLTAPASGPVVMTADAADTPGTEIYSLKVFPYETVYIGLVQTYLARPDASWIDVQLAVSHDGIHFTRVGDRSPFIALGEVGEWDRFNHALANNDPIAVGDELRFYYSGRTYRHTPYKGPDTGPTRGGIGFAGILRDRFVALEASFDKGVIETKPVTLTGPLHLNAEARFGEINIEVLDLDGHVVARGGEVRSGGLDVPVRWAGGKAPPKGSPVRLRITLANAQLFALWCD